MKILHIAESIRGGCGTYLNEIVPLQVRALGADNVRVLVPRQHLDQLVDIDPALVWHFERPSRARGLPRLGLATRRVLQRWQPDLVHTHSTFAGAVTRLIGGGVGDAPIVYCPHGWVFDVMRSPRARAMSMAAERWMAPRSARIVAISQAERLQGLAAGIAEQRMVVVPNGVRDRIAAEPASWGEDALPAVGTRLKVLFVGRLDRQKGIDILIDAVRSLGDRLSVHVVGAQVLAGAGSTDQPLPPHIEMLGWQAPDDVARQVQACDLVVMPSRWEGFGLVAVEAMRAGKAVFAAAVGGLREIVVDGVTGRLFAPGDAMALQGVLLAHDRIDLVRMGAAGRARYLANYTSERTHDGLMLLYKDVLDKHKLEVKARHPGHIDSPAVQSRYTGMRPASAQTIGDLLRSIRPLSDSDIDHILETQLRMKVRFGEAAVALQLVSRPDLLWALSEQFTYPTLRHGEDPRATELAVVIDLHGSQADAFHDLRRIIMSNEMVRGRTPLAIVSPDHGDGRTHVAAHLAVTFSRLGERTVLVDGNLRNPALHKVFGLKERDSLVELLKGRKPVKPFDGSPEIPGLFVMQAGTPSLDARQLLEQPMFGVLLRELQREFDRVIVDTPPARHSSDARWIAANCRQAVLVGRHGRTQAKTMNLLVDRLRHMHAGIAGVVLNAY